jgi:cation transport regulator
MPYSKDSPPERIKGLPSHAKEIWVSAFNSAFKEYDEDEEKSNAVAWSAVKTKYKQESDGTWVAKTEDVKKSGPFKLFFDIEKSFNPKKSNLLKDMNLEEIIPEIFKNLDLESGVYSYGVASTIDVDSQGERVIVPDDVMGSLTKPPYNKVFISHQNMDIASGVIKFAGRAPELNNEFVILERINEFHPNFQSIVGSIQNGNLDSYSVAGDAEVDYDYASGQKIRKVTSLKEVSRTSYPANPHAGIQGMFFIKTAKGGYAYETEHESMIKAAMANDTEENMEDTLKTTIEAMQKSMVELTEKVNAMNTELTDKVNGLLEFRKNLESQAPAPKAEDIAKSVETQIEKALSTKLEPKKSVDKQEEPFKKTQVDNDMTITNFLKSGRMSLNTGGAK